LTSTDEEAANMLADTFRDMFTKEDSDKIQDRGHLISSTPEVPSWQDADMDFSRQAVLQKLQKLSPDKTAGPDGIHPMLLRTCANAVADPLSIIFRASFESGSVPADWKTANVMPIYKKKGSRTDPANYRLQTYIANLSGMQADGVDDQRQADRLHRQK